MTPSIRFLGWHEPLARLVADALWLDREFLYRRLVIFPTQEAGRRVRELLLDRGLREGLAGLLGPRLGTPEAFLRPPAALPDVLRWAGWIRVLGQVSNAEVQTLFPQGISGRDERWRLGLARQLEQARELLASVDQGFAEVAERWPDEQERWRELAALEGRVIEQWRRWGAADPVHAKREAANRPVMPAGVDEILIVGVPDPTPLAVEAWRRLAAGGARISIWVGAPEEYRSRFDEWGRPDPAFWTDRSRHAVPAPSRTLVAADAQGLAECAVQACAGRSNLEVALGLCDPAFGPAVERRFRQAGWTVYDPETSAQPREGWPELLEGLAAMLEAPESYAALARLARHPALWERWLETGARGAFEALDRWELQHRPGDAREAIQRLRDASEVSLSRLGAYLGGVFSRVLQCAQLNVCREQLFAWSSAAPEFQALLRREFAGWEKLAAADVGAPERLRWLALSASALPRPPEAPGALPLQGWLELAFDPAPYLVLAALHEGKVPEAPSADPLIGEAAREQLRLRDRRGRLAREIFLQTSLVEARRGRGGVTVITAQTDPRGDSCRPSRVLLHAPAADLPARVLTLVKDHPDAPLAATPARQRQAWLWSVPPEAPRNREWGHLSPSRLRAYLECPARFYFRQVLKCEEFEPAGEALDGRAFGDLLHQVFESWGKDPAARELAEAAALRRCWLELLDQTVERRFGRRLPPLLRLQVLSARERLGALAAHQAREYADGWRVLRSEEVSEGALRLGGLPLHLRVDRIDRHEGTGEVRVIDYKTAQKGEDPKKLHLRTYNPDLCPPPLGPFPFSGKKECCWTDLQLPLYSRVVQQVLDLAAPPRVFYALLPPVVSDIGFVEFKELPDLLPNAMVWAEEAARRIVAGVFWPPAPQVRYDLFAAIAPDGLRQALHPDWAEFLKGTAV